MIQEFLHAPMMTQWCSTCEDHVYGFHEHNHIVLMQSILGSDHCVTVHFPHGSIAWQLWDRLKFMPFDWDSRLREIGEINDMAANEVLIHTEERGIWWRAHRRRLTYDYVVRFNDGISFHIYLSTMGDVKFEVSHVFSSTAS
jgi:hypothetical protein